MTKSRAGAKWPQGADLNLEGEVMAIADLAIHGSYLAYGYVVISILYLQTPDLNRRLRQTDKTPSASDFYSVAIGYLETGLNRVSWLLSVMWGRNSGWPTGRCFSLLPSRAA
jgi:hypothetical protein